MRVRVNVIQVVSEIRRRAMYIREHATGRTFETNEQIADLVRHVTAHMRPANGEPA